MPAPLPQAGAVEPENAPQSRTTMRSLPDSGFAPSESSTAPRVSVNSPDSVPVLAMSTVPTVAASPGRMPAALRTAAPALSFDIVSEPVANVFAGFADGGGEVRAGGDREAGGGEDGGQGRKRAARAMEQIRDAGHGSPCRFGITMRVIEGVDIRSTSGG